jgi:signal transduction histidine kinase
MKHSLRPWNRSLTARLTGTFFVLSLLAVILAGGLAYMQARKTLTESVYERLQAVATLKEDGLNRWVDKQRLSIVFITSIPEVRRQSGALINTAPASPEWGEAYSILQVYLTSVISELAELDELLILNLDGKVLLSTLPDHEGQFQNYTIYFQKGRSNTYIQPVYKTEGTGKPTLTVATPLYDENQQRVGVLAGHLNLARIDRIILERTGLGTSGETYLINPSFEFVSAARFNDPDRPAGTEVRSPGIEAALREETGSGLYANYRGIPVIGVYTWLEDEGVALLSELSQEEAFTPAEQLAWTILEFGLLAVAILAGTAFFIARRIAKPILAINSAAAHVASGDLTHSAPVMTDDEVGTLAKSFNEMTEQLFALYEDLEMKVAERTTDLVRANRRLSEEIADRQRAEDQLRDQNAYLAALHDTSLGLIGRLDLNELFEDLVVRAGKLMDTPNGYIYVVDPEADEIVCRVGVGIFSDLVGFRLKKGKGFGGTVWKTGEALIIDDYDHWPNRAQTVERNLIRSVIGIPLRSGQEVVGVIGLAYDFDMDPGRKFGSAEIELLERFAHLATIALDNARLYTAAQQARATAEAANDAKSVFLASVSHELRTPLTAIIGFTQIVKKRLHERIFPLLPDGETKLARTREQVDENLQIILQEGERLTTLINDLLDLEKIQAGKMTWNMRPLQVVEAVNHAASATTALFEEKGLVWEQDIAPDLPEIVGDYDRLVQVLINLISNAVKFTKAGNISCRVQQVGDDIVVLVKDEGIGIARDDHPRVFEKFNQVGDALTNKPKGTGLGLPISKQIIEYHGGRIWLESELNRGSTFYFSLPVRNPVVPQGTGLAAEGAVPQENPEMG